MSIKTRMTTYMKAKDKHKKISRKMLTFTKNASRTKDSSQRILYIYH